MVIWYQVCVLKNVWKSERIICNCFEQETIREKNVDKNDEMCVYVSKMMK